MRAENKTIETQGRLTAYYQVEITEFKQAIFALPKHSPPMGVPECSNIATEGTTRSRAPGLSGFVEVGQIRNPMPIYNANGIERAIQ